MSCQPKRSWTVSSVVQFSLHFAPAPLEGVSDVHYSKTHTHTDSYLVFTCVVFRTLHVKTVYALKILNTEKRDGLND